MEVIFLKKEFKRLRVYKSIMEQYQYLIDNQNKWCKMYNEQEKIKKDERIKTNKEKEWFGNSKIYKTEWDANNKRKVKQVL